MLVRAMLAGLDRAESPRAVALWSRGLELATGWSTGDILDRKYVSESWSTTEEEKWRRIRGEHSNYTGRTVTTDTALEVTAVYACVKIISEDLGREPFAMLEDSEDGEQTNKAYDHPLYPILHDM